MIIETTQMERRGLKPATILAANRPHGDRLRYIAGCHCDECRAANTDYERQRRGERKAGNWNGLVAAQHASNHIKHLSTQGVGRRAVAEASGVSHTLLADIRSGRRMQIRALTERRILGVTTEMALDRALVPAAPTRKLINALIAAGFTKKLLGQRMGYKNTLQLDRKEVTVRNAARVRRLHQDLINSDDAQVSSKGALKRIALLREEGYTEKQIDRHLDIPGGHASIDKPRITRRLDRLVKTVFERLTT